MARKVYNPNDNFSGFKFSHGKAQTHQVEESFNPANWEFMCGEKDVIRAGAVILINDKVLISAVDFASGDAVELAMGDGIYEAPASVAVGEFATLYVAETDDGATPPVVTGVALRTASNDSTAGMGTKTLSEAGTTTFRHILSV